MKQFFWIISGADIELLKQCKDESQQRFAQVGLNIVVVYLLIFTSFSIFIWHEFDNIFMSFFVASIVTFLIGSIYQINLLNLEPNSLPYIPSNGTKFVSFLVHYTTIALFGFFVSKILETIFFGQFALEAENMRLLKFNKFDTNTEFIHQMMILNQKYPVIYVITVSVIILFVLPIFLKKKLKNKSLEYYKLKSERDERLVLNDYRVFKVELNNRYKKLYELHNPNELLKNIKPIIFSRFDLSEANRIYEVCLTTVNKHGIYEFEEHQVRYFDPPFNTKTIDDKENLKSSDEFMKLFY